MFWYNISYIFISFCSFQVFSPPFFLYIYYNIKIFLWQGKLISIAFIVSLDALSQLWKSIVFTAIFQVLSATGFKPIFSTRSEQVKGAHRYPHTTPMRPSGTPAPSGLVNRFPQRQEHREGGRRFRDISQLVFSSPLFWLFSLSLIKKW